MCQEPFTQMVHKYQNLVFQTVDKAPSCDGAFLVS